MSSFPHLTLPLISTLFLFLLYTSLPVAESADALYQFCGKTGNYTANSTYATNLETVFNNLTKGATNSTTKFGFATTSVGSVPNLISGLVLCRGDVNYTICSSCITQATQDIQNLCPYDKEATIYYDYCLLRYSNQNFLSSTDNSNQIILYNTQNVSMSFSRFDNLVDYLLNSTANYAAFNNSKKFGTSQMNVSNPSTMIRGLVQCTPDMSGSDCDSCLQNLFSQSPNFFSGRQGGRILGVRCNFRYEIYSFYDGPALLMVTPPAENAPAPGPSLTPRVINPPSSGIKEASNHFNSISSTSNSLILVRVIYNRLKFNNLGSEWQTTRKRRKTNTNGIQRQSISEIVESRYSGNSLKHRT